MKQRGRVISQQRKAMQGCPQIKTNQSASSKYTHKHTHTERETHTHTPDRESASVCVCRYVFGYALLQFSLACLCVFFLRKRKLLMNLAQCFVRFFSWSCLSFFSLCMLFVRCKAERREIFLIDYKSHVTPVGSIFLFSLVLY